MGVLAREHLLMYLDGFVKRQIQSPKDSDAANMAWNQESAFLASTLDDSDNSKWSVDHTWKSSATALSSENSPELPSGES